MGTNLIISYSYGRLLRVLSNFQMINKDNKLLDISLSIGKEFVREYLLESYKRETKAKNKNLTFLDWKTSNNTKVELVNESEFVFEIGSKVVSWLLQLEFVNSIVKVLSKTEKVNILVQGNKLKELGNKLKELFYNVNKPAPVRILPNRLPMIVKPKLYQWNSKKTVKKVSIQN